MNCQEIPKYIQLYIDGELQETEKQQLAEHIECCPRCHRLVRIERQFKMIIIQKTRTIRVQAPARLKRRIRTVIF